IRRSHFQERPGRFREDRSDADQGSRWPERVSRQDGSSRQRSSGSEDYLQAPNGPSSRAVQPEYCDGTVRASIPDQRPIRPGIGLWIWFATCLMNLRRLCSRMVNATSGVQSNNLFNLNLTKSSTGNPVDSFAQQLATAIEGYLGKVNSGSHFEIDVQTGQG